uniref:UBX domain-containing protein n=1 Tax=Strigamia maritima TaxID=126957 RepID=T1JCR2_STRMM
MADEEELSPVQTEKLLQFQDLTGIEEIDRCRRLLEMHNWDIEVAVQDTLNMQEGSPSVFHPPSNNAPQVVTHPDDQRVYIASASSRQLGLVGWTYYFLTFPVRLLYNTFFSLLSFAYVTDPVADVMNFITDYETRYGTLHPVFYQGTYSQVLNDAKRELKFLLVYLHSDEHQDTAEFCRSTLRNADLIQFVNINTLFWACSVRSPEGYRVSQALRENSYPFLAVIVLRENRMTVVARIEGIMKPVELLTRLRQVLSENEGSLIAARADRHERNLNQTIRQQQDEAYLESLKADQEKEKRKREEQEKKEKIEQDVRDQQMAAERKREEISRLKVELAYLIPQEPPLNHPDCIRIVIKLPNGTRLERRFLKTCSLKVLYYYVFCHPDSPNQFQVVTNFPRRVLPCEPSTDNPDPPTFAFIGLGPSETLFVHDLEA